MSKDIVFKLVVSESGKDAYSSVLSFQQAANIIGYFPDDASSNDLCLLAAQHPASVVREHVADRDYLSSEVLEILSADSSISVLRKLVRSDAFRESVTQEELLGGIKLDTEIAKTVAYSVESYVQVDINIIASLLAEHEDPQVVYCLAQNDRAPKKILKTLLNHPDFFVANEAKRQLEH